VKSPVTGRDFNPMGRGDGAYYAQGAFAIYEAKSGFVGEITTGFGNSICNGEAIPVAADLGGSQFGCSRSKAAGECCGTPLSMLPAADYSVLGGLGPGTVPPGWSGFPCVGYCPPCCSAGCICSGSAMTCLCDLSKPWRAPVGARGGPWVPPGHGLAGSYHAFMPGSGIDPWRPMRMPAPNSWEYCCGSSGYERPPGALGPGTGGTGGNGGQRPSDGGIEVRRPPGEGHTGGGGEGVGPSPPPPKPPSPPPGGGLEEDPHNCCCLLMYATVKEMHDHSCWCYWPGVPAVDLDSQSLYFFEIKYPVVGRCSCKESDAIPPGWRVGRVDVKLYVWRLRELRYSGQFLNCRLDSTPQDEATFDYICPAVGQPWPRVTGWTLQKYIDPGGVEYWWCDMGISQD